MALIVAEWPFLVERAKFDSNTINISNTYLIYLLRSSNT